MGFNDDRAFCQSAGDSNAFVQSTTDDRAYECVELCPQPTTVRRVTVTPVISGDGKSVTFTWTETGFPRANTTLGDDDVRVVIVQRLSGDDYNCEEFAAYPLAEASRYDKTTTPTTLGHPQPVPTVKHLAGVANAATCDGYGEWQLHYLTSGDNPWTTADAVLAMYDRAENNQRFSSNLFGATQKPVVRAKITNIQTGGSPQFNKYYTLDFSVSETEGRAEPADNLFTGPNDAWTSGVYDATNGQQFIVDTPEGINDGSTTFLIHGRWAGPQGTNAAKKDADFSEDVDCWIGQDKWRAGPVSHDNFPAPGYTPAVNDILTLISFETNKAGTHQAAALYGLDASHAHAADQCNVVET